jgi:predicted DNA-binding protein
MARKNLSGLVGNDADTAAAAAAETATTKSTPAPAEPVATPQPAPSAAPATPPAPVETPARKPRGPRRSTPAAEAGERETASKGVPVHLTEELNERLQAYMTRKRWSHQTVLLDAIEATYTRLPDLIREATAADDEATERTPLFDRPSRPTPKASGEARIKHTVRMSDSNRNTLDDITEKLGAPSRNFLITVAYEAYLPTIEKS